MGDTALRLKRHYTIVAHSPDEVEFRYGVWNPASFTIVDESKGGHLFLLVKRLDGSVSPGQLAREVGVPREEVESLIDHLQELGALETGSGSALDHYLDHIVPWRAEPEGGNPSPILLLGDGILTAAIAGLLRESAPDAVVEVLATNHPGWELLLKADTANLVDGLRFEQMLDHFKDWENHLLIYASLTPHPVRLQLLNRVCLALRTAWLHAAIDGPFLFVGPLTVPRRSACYECLEARIMMNLRERASYLRYKEALVEREVLHGTLPVMPALSGMLASHTALEALNFSVTGASTTINKVLSIYLPTMEFSYNEVLRVPGCAACGPVPERDETGVYFDIGAVLSQ